MLRHVVGPISQGLGIFMVVAAALLLPSVIWQHRRFGRVGPRRALVHSTFVLYDAYPDRLGWTLAAAVLPPAGWLVLLGVVALLRRDRRSLPDLLAGTRVLSG